MEKNRFIESTEENIQKYKNRYYKIVCNDLMKLNEKVYVNAPKKYWMTHEQAEQLTSEMYDAQRMANHKTVVYGTEYDLYDYISNIQDKDLEHECIVLCDENKRPFDSKIITVGDSISVGDTDAPVQDALRYILANKRAKYFIHVHNHPHCIATYPSFGDKMVMIRHKIIGNLIRIPLLDVCIINEFDFYSQRQYELTPDSEKILNYTLRSDFAEEMIKKNLAIWTIMRQALEK